MMLRSNWTRTSANMWILILSICLMSGMTGSAAAQSAADDGVYPAVTPHVVSVTPDEGSGLYQQFDFVFSDASGYGDLKQLHILFGTNKDDNRALFIRFDCYSGEVRIGTRGRFSTSMPGGTLGENRVVENDYVKVDLTRVTLNPVDSNTLALRMFLDFRGKDFEGSFGIHAAAYDIQTLTEDYRQLGTFTVERIANTHAPKWISMSPDDGEGRNQVFTFIIEDEDGAEDVNFFLVRFSGRGKRYPEESMDIRVRPGDRTLQANLSGRRREATIGSDRKLRAEFGKIDMNETSLAIDRGGDRLIFRLKVEFNNKAAGRKKVMGFALDSGGNDSGDKDIGNFLVQYTSSAPRPLFILPGRIETPSDDGVYIRSPLTISSWWYDTDGVDDMNYLSLKIAQNSGGRIQVIHLLISPSDNAIALKDDVGAENRWTTFGGGTVSNGVGELIGADSRMTRISDNTLKIDVALRLKPLFTGSRKIWGRGEDFSFNLSGWRRLGFITVTDSNSRPSNRKVTPFFDTGTGGYFMFEFRDPDGPRDILSAEVGFSEDDDLTHGARLVYNQYTDVVHLAVGESSISAPIDSNIRPAIGGVKIFMDRTYVIHWKDRLRLFVYLEFDPEQFSGYKNIYMMASDYKGKTSRRQVRGGYRIEE